MNVVVKIADRPSVKIATFPRGPAGPSAYEVAVANGFVGTEAQWLASLEGPPAPDLTDEFQALEAEFEALEADFEAFRNSLTNLPTATVQPRINGSTQAGNTIVPVPGTYANAVSVVSRFTRNGTEIPLASFTTTEADIGATFALADTATNAAGQPVVFTATFGPITSLPAAASLLPLPDQAVSIGSGDIVFDLRAFVNNPAELRLTFTVSGEPNTFLLNPAELVIEVSSDAITTATTPTITVTMTDEFARSDVKAFELSITQVLDPTIAGLVDEAPFGFATRHNTALAADISGLPDEIVWQTAPSAAFSSSAVVSGATTVNFTPVIGSNVPDTHYVRVGARYGTQWRYSPAYQVRFPPATIIGTLPDRTYATGYPIPALATAQVFSAPNLSGVFSASPAAVAMAPGIVVNSSTGEILGTPTASGARASAVRRTDQYGRSIDAPQTITTNTITAAIVGAEPNARVVVTVGEDTDPTIPVSSITITGGSYAGTYATDALGQPMTIGTFQALGAGLGHPIVPPVIGLTTDGGTANVLNTSDVAARSLEGLWAREEGDTLTITLDWRDDDGALGDTDASYTGTGAEIGDVFLTETNGAKTAVSNTIPTATVSVAKSFTAIGSLLLATPTISTGNFGAVAGYNWTGAAEGDDLLIAVMMDANSGATSVNAITIGGAPAARIPDTVTRANPSEAVFFRMTAPSTLGDISIQPLNGTLTAVGFQVWKLTACGAPLGINGSEGSGVLSRSADLDVLTGDLVFGCAVHTGTTLDITLTGFTAPAQGNTDTSFHAVGAHVCTTDETPRALSAATTAARGMSFCTVRF